MKITNNGTAHITIMGADGEARTLKAGQTDNISYDSKNPLNAAYERQGAITVEGRDASASKARRSSSRRSSRKAAKASAADSASEA